MVLAQHHTVEKMMSFSRSEIGRILGPADYTASAAIQCRSRAPSEHLPHQTPSNTVNDKVSYTCEDDLVVG